MNSYSKFLESISSDLADGYHFVPFLGAGFSQSAGFPITTELARHHFAYWIIRALELNPLAVDESEITLKLFARWHPRDGWWPMIGDEILGVSGSQTITPFTYERASTLLDWARSIKEVEHLNENADQAKVGVSLDTLNRACALLNREKPAYWLAIVQFLASLTKCSESPDNIIYSGPERQSVVDSLFIHLNNLCEPSLGHRLLASLVPVWKSRVILTTNFDTLVERAFAEIQEPIEVFEVPKTAPLPDANLVLSQLSLVKLHGGRFDVRADSSVSASLNREDMKNALGYIAGRSLFANDIISFPGAKLEKAAIIFFGCGAEDPRTNNFAQHVAQHFPLARVYWISFSDKTKAKVPTLDFFNSKDHTRVVRFHCPDFGLLLLQLFQHLTSTIPTSGTMFPGPWQLSSPPLIPNEDEPYKKRREAPATEVELYIKSVFAPVLPSSSVTASSTPPETARPLVVYLGKENYGAAVICIPIFNNTNLRRDHGFRCLWIEADAVTMPAGVFARILMMASRMEGVIDPLTTLDLDGLTDSVRSEGFIATVERALIGHWARTGLRLVIFINLTETPGESALFALDHDQSGAKRWDSENEVTNFFSAIERLNKTTACGVQFIIMSPRQRCGFFEASSEVTTDILLRNASKDWKIVEADEPATPFSPIDSAKAAVAWIGEAPRTWEKRLRQSFMVLLLCFRQSRYPVAITRVFKSFWEQNQPVEDIVNEEFCLKDWLPSLEKKRVLRFLDGGFVWVNNQVAKSILDIITQPALGDSSVVLHMFPLMRACIARWYGRLLIASSDPLAAVEGIFQNVEGVRAMSALNPQRKDAIQAEAMLGQAGFLLNTARALFERRLATAFADRSLATLCQYIKKLIGTRDAWEGFPAVMKSAENLFDNITAVRATVALREAQFKSLHEDWANPTALFGTNCEQSSDLNIQRYAGSLHLRDYETAESGFLEQWNQYVDVPLKELAATLWGTAQALDIKEDKIAANASSSARTLAHENGLRSGAPDKCAQLRILMRLARWGVYLHLNRSQVALVTSMSRIEREDPRAANLRDEAKKSRVASIRKAEWFLEFGLELLRSASDTGDGFIFEESVRLRGHGALVLGIIESFNTKVAPPGQKQSPPRFTRAWSLLRDADSFMGGFPIDQIGVTSAIVRLRAAELCLLEVHSIGWFQEMRRAVRKLKTKDSNLRSQSTRDWFRDVQSALKKNEPAGHSSGNARGTDPWTEDECNQAAFRVSESLEWLEKAEDALIAHPKSRWWWWIFAVLRMRACEYLYLIRFARSVVGLAENTNPRKDPKIVVPTALRFIDSGLTKLIHEKDLGDCFYLARIVRSFAEVFRTKTLYDSSIDPEPKRRNSEDGDAKSQAARARDSLIARARTLRDLVEKLKQLREKSSNADINKYTDRCLDEAEKVLSGWPKDLHH